ncbi:MAG: GDSL-type esterase/lipase family protein [Suilimivivens sp.]
MSKVNKALGMLIAMVAIMIMAVGIDRGMKHFEQKQWEKEKEIFNEEARADIADVQATIKTLSEDPEAIAAYIAENELNYVEPGEIEESDQISEEENIAESEEAGMVDEEELLEIEEEESSVSDNIPEDDTVSGNTVSGNTVSGNTVSGNTVSGNTVSGNTVSGNTVSGNTVSGNTVSGNTVQEKELCASYEETIKLNQVDKEIIEGSTIDFSGKKIACLGDSITAAANLENEENYLQMSYPWQLGEILGAKEVVNLGIGGSSIGRYWENAFVDRYQEIPEDTDIIIVMGGTNDGFCASETELGSLDERKERTFAGDLDELLRKLKEDYPKAEIVLVTPLSNVLHDMLRRDRDYMLPQSSFVKMMKQLGAEYEVPVIDLYNSNLLNTHDAAVIHSFMPDGVHGNQLGYRILAEHIAAELIKMESVKAETETGTEGAGTSEQRL